MNLLRLNKLITFLLFSLISVCASAQSDLEYSDYLLKYKMQSEVVLLDEAVFKIKNDDGKLSIIKENYFESLILDEIGINNFSESFYDSELSPVLEYEAYTISKKGKEIKSDLIKQTSNDDASIFYDEIKRNQVTYKSLEPGARKVLKTKVLYKDANLLSRYIFQ